MPKIVHMCQYSVHFQSDNIEDVIEHEKKCVFNPKLRRCASCMSYRNCKEFKNGRACEYSHACEYYHLHPRFKNLEKSVLIQKRREVKNG